MNETITVNIRLFAAARHLAQRPTLQLQCADDTTIAELRQALAAQCPPLRPLLAHVRFAVNGHYAGDDQTIRAEDEIACVPPVSGG